MIPVPEPRLKSLYQEVILDHNKRPRNYRELPSATRHSHGVNPLCGDDYRLYLEVDDAENIQDVGFLGQGCAISKASASMMTTLIKGKSVREAQTLLENFLTLMTKDPVSEETRKNAGRVSFLEGVKEFPIRVKCATLIWHALKDALKGDKS